MVKHGFWLAALAVTVLPIDLRAQENGNSLAPAQNPAAESAAIDPTAEVRQTAIDYLWAGAALLEEGEFGAANDEFVAAALIFDELDDTLNLAVSVSWQSVVAERSGDVQREFELTRQAAALLDLLPDTRDPSSPAIYGRLGNAYVKVGRVSEALAPLARAVELSRQINGPGSEDTISWYVHLATAQSEDSRLFTAARTTGEAIEALGQNEISFQLAMSLYQHHSNNLLRVGDAQGAEAAARLALGRALTHPDGPTDYPSSMALLTRSMEAGGKVDEALQWLSEGLAFMEETGGIADTDTAAQLLLLAQAQARVGRFAEARATAAQIIERAEAHPAFYAHVRGEAEVLLNWGPNGAAQ